MCNVMLIIKKSFELELLKKVSSFFHACLQILRLAYRQYESFIFLYVSVLFVRSGCFGKVEFSCLPLLHTGQHKSQVHQSCDLPPCTTATQLKVSTTNRLLPWIPFVPFTFPAVQVLNLTIKLLTLIRQSQHVTIFSRPYGRKIGTR
jgi:hypothetical protein